MSALRTGEPAFVFVWAFVVLWIVGSLVTVPSLWFSQRSAERNVMRLAELHARYQEALIIILLKATSRDGEGRLRAKLDQDRFRGEDLKSLLGRENYLFFKRQVLDVEDVVDRLAGSVRREASSEIFWRNVISVIGRGWRQSKYNATQEEEDLQVIRAIEKAIFPIEQAAKTNRQWAFSRQVWPSTEASDRSDHRHTIGIIMWILDETVTSNLFSRLEGAIVALDYLVRVVKPPREATPDFSSQAIMICWHLDPTESDSSEALPNLPSNDIVFRNQFLESVLNQYPRTLVPLDDIRPGGRYRGVCKLQMKFQGSPALYGGTGWLIDNDTVVTAAHCLYRPSEKTFAIKVDVHIGQTTQTGIDTKPDRRRGAYIALHYGYYVGYQTKHDFAIIKLDQPFSDSSSIAPQDCPLLVQNTTMRVVGYPLDLPSNQSRKGLDMYVSECPVTPVSEYALKDTKHLLEYWLDTSGGNSGSPVLSVAQDGTFHSIGVHCKGGTVNYGSALGHEGNRLLAFQQGLKQTTFATHITSAGGDANTVKVQIPGSRAQTP